MDDPSASPTPQSFEDFEHQYSNDQWSKNVLIGGIIMYAGAVLFGLFRNLQLFQPTFAGSDYAQVGYFAVILLALNAFVLPMFIHKRASGAQFFAAIIFYVIEMLIYVMNAAVEPRAAVIAKATEWGFWEWYYWNVAFVAPILVMVAWGIIFLLDAESAMSRATAEARGAMIGTFAKKTKVLANHPSTTARVHGQAQGFIDALGGRILPSARKPSQTLTPPTEVSEQNPNQTPSNASGLVQSVTNLLASKNGHGTDNAPKA